jgi:RecJ-like exonuclease
LKRLLFIHGDTDGVCSGALALYYYRNVRNQDVKIVFTHPAGLYKDLQEFMEKEADIFIADIALAEDTYTEIINLLNKLSAKNNVVYVDHHPLPTDFRLNEASFEFIHDLNASSSELTYRLLEDNLGIDYSRIFIFGAIGDYLDETPVVKKWIDYWDKRAVYFEAGVLAQGLEATRKMYDFKRHVVEHLSLNRLPSSLSELLVKALIESQNEEEMRGRVKQNIIKLKHVSYVIEPGGSLGRAANYARIYGGTPVGVAVQFLDDIANMSIRSDRNIDINIILRKIVKEYGATGGGHPNAAGARVKKKHLEDFLKRIDREVEADLLPALKGEVPL